MAYKYLAFRAVYSITSQLEYSVYYALLLMPLRNASHQFHLIFFFADFISKYVSYIFNTLPTASSTEQVSVKYTMN